MAELTEFSARLRDVIERCAQSQTEFSRTLGIAEASVRGYLKSVTPPATFLSRVCEVYKVDGTWLLTGAGDMFSTGSGVSAGNGAIVGSPQNTTTNDATILMEVIRHLQDENKKLTDALIELKK